MAPETRRRSREGSPWRGLGAVITKEMADNLTSARMRILEILVVLTAVGTGYSALQQLTGSEGQDQFLFLKLFTTARDPLLRLFCDRHLRRAGRGDGREHADAFCFL